MNELFRVETKKDRKWKYWSEHKNFINAEVNRDIKRKSGLKARIVHKGRVIEKESDIAEEPCSGNAQDEFDVYAEVGEG